MNAEAKKCYLQAKAILQFSKDSYKEIREVRLASDIGSVGKLGMKRAKLLIKKCEESAKMYNKAGKAFTSLAKMLYRVYKNKTFELTDSEKLKFDSVVKNLVFYLENTKEIEKEGREVSSIITRAFALLAQKERIKANALRYRQRSRNYYHNYGRSYYNRYRYYYDGYNYWY
jgi:hypothetical protein